jgi:hypothetical protein
MKELLFLATSTAILLLVAIPVLPIQAQNTDFEVEINAGEFYYARFVCSTDDVLSGDFTATVGGVDNDVDFFVFDSENYANFQGLESYTAALEYQKTAGRSWSFTVPYDDTWYVVYSNAYSWFTSKHVEGYHNLVPAETLAAQMMNTGIALSIVGVGGFALILVMAYFYRRRSSPVRVREVLLVLCPHCGYKNDQMNRACSNCGAQL